MMDADGNETVETDRSGERYFVTDHNGVERETDAAGFVEMERRCGFRAKPGCGPFATAGFSSGERSGRIEFAARSDAMTGAAA